MSARDDGFDEVVHEFIAESGEILARMDESLVALERSPEDAELLAGVFRGFHTIKGNSSFLGFARVQEAAHAAEALLALLRDRGGRPTSAEISALLEAVDAIRALIAPIATSGKEAAKDVAPLVRRLSALTGPSEPVAEEAPAAGAADPGPRPANDGTVRVDVGLLDRLMDGVGELVLARNQLLLHVPASGDASANHAAHRLSLITSRLQEGIMKTRLQPVGNLVHRFARVVRDLAVSCGKRARLEVSGEGTELDRAILEAISEPLTHILRNAVDHGIEAPAERIRRGKPEEGVVRIQAYQESGQVVLEVGDDGAGVDLAKVREKSRRLGHPGADTLPEAELLNLIFARGFSTCEEVTHLSGRGVGMDVVKTNLERVGGIIELRNAPGRGLTLRVRIPLTLAILPALIISARGERFALPQGCLLELIRPGEAGAERGIERIHDAPVYRLRDRLLPLVDLSRILDLDRPASESPTIVVLRAGDQAFGLVVDRVHDTEELVVKSLSHRLREVDLYAGAAILGDARIALILDVAGLARRAKFAAATPSPDLLAAPEPPPKPVAPARRLLLLRGEDDGRLAIELDDVARLEMFAPETIERMGGREVTQYHGDILPLVRIGEALPERRTRRRAEEDVEDAGPLPVVVYRRSSGNVGLVVRGILDILEEAVGPERPASRRGVGSCAVVRDRVTEILDVERLLEIAAERGNA